MEYDVAPWAQTVSGRAVDLLSPTPDQIDLQDIATSLSRIPRFNGHTTGDYAWNVAEHSVLVANLLPHGSPRELHLAALLHDAHESYTGDIINPMQAAIRESAGSRGDPIRLIQSGLQRAIYLHFRLPEFLNSKWYSVIKLADMQALRLEKEQLTAASPRPWVDLPDIPEHGRHIILRRRPALDSRDGFLFAMKGAMAA